MSTFFETLKILESSSVNVFHSNAAKYELIGLDLLKANHVKQSHQVMRALLNTATSMVLGSSDQSGKKIV